MTTAIIFQDQDDQLLLAESDRRRYRYIPDAAVNAGQGVHDLEQATAGRSDDVPADQWHSGHPLDYPNGLPIRPTTIAIASGIGEVVTDLSIYPERCGPRARRYLGLAVLDIAASTPPNEPAGQPSDALPSIRTAIASVTSAETHLSQFPDSEPAYRYVRDAGQALATAQRILRGQQLRQTESAQ